MTYQWHTPPLTTGMGLIVRFEGGGFLGFLATNLNRKNNVELVTRTSFHELKEKTTTAIFSRISFKFPVCGVVIGIRGSSGSSVAGISIQSVLEQPAVPSVTVS